MNYHIVFKKQIRVLAILLILSLFFVGCAKDIKTDDKPLPNEQIPKDEINPDENDKPKEIIFEYLINERANRNERVYYSEDAPDIPQEGDYRIDGIRYVGEKLIYETFGVAYEIDSSSYYFTRNEKSEKIYNWHKYDPYYIVLNRSGYDDTWEGVFGQTHNIDSNKTIEEIILEVVYNIEDIEASILLDGYPQYVGPFSSPRFFREEHKSEKLEGWEPIYREGDYWIQYYYNNLTAICYYNSEEEQAVVNRIETTRTDVSTYRGIRVGSTKDEVLMKYPNIYNIPYWDYQGDYLWYCNNDGGFGSALLFWFENNTVVKIEINNMFD